MKIESGKKRLVIESNMCKGCGICVAFCPKGALELVNEKVSPKEGSNCVACGLCELRCPDYALYLENVEE